MKILYIANVRMPTEKAHGIQIAKMCEAFGLAGHEVTLVLPKRKNPIHDGIFSYYHLQKKFKINRIWCLDVIQLYMLLGKWAYYLQSLTFAWSVMYEIRKLRKCENSYDILYTRDIGNLMYISTEKPIIYEAHNIPQSQPMLFKKLINKISKFVVLTQSLKEEFVKIGVNAEKILISPDAVDLAQFGKDMSKLAIRKKVTLPKDKTIILYTGHLYPWKGVYTMLRAAREFDKDEYLFVFVGGTNSDSKKFKEKINEIDIKNVKLVRHQVHHDMPLFLHAADILVLPNSAEKEIFAKHTSPLKLFEYMAAERPIVASDLPSIREVLDEELAEMVPADDPKALAVGIKAALHGEELSKSRVDKARKKVEEFTWEKRANKIIDFINC
jgi:glycosyltransferase involved in cell wall biosynthesis